MKLVVGGTAPPRSTAGEPGNGAMRQDLTDTAGPLGAALVPAERRRRGPAGFRAPARPDHPGGSGVLKFCTLAESTHCAGACGS